MELREPTLDEAERIREMVESAMTASYSLSPQQIEDIVEDQFDDELLSRSLDDPDLTVLVAEDGEETETVVGLVSGHVDGDTGEIRWLFVDPEHRGQGIGTQLFETMVQTFRDRGVEHVEAVALQTSNDGDQFFEQFDLERTEERETEFGGQSLAEYVYAESSDVDEPAASAETGGDEVDFPGAEVEDGVVTATTDDDRRMYIAPDEEESGTEARFLHAYTDEDHTERFGYYCANCGSLDVSMDDMDRLKCGNCGNAHASRSSESYDDSYL